MSNTKITGILPVTITPMHENGDIDFDGLEKLLHFLLDKDIGGLWVLGTSSEDMSLTFEKRLAVARRTAEVVDGQVPILLGTAFFAPENTLNFIKETGSLKIAGYHFMPYHQKISFDRLEKVYTSIADHCSHPLWMYSSANYSIPHTPEFVARLKPHKNIAGIKYSTRSTTDQLKVIALADDSFQVITSVADQTYPCLCMGAKAHTTSIASCFPELLISIYSLFKAGKHQEALAEQIRFIDFMGDIPKRTRQDNFMAIAEEKFVLSERGVCKEYTSSYYSQFTDDEKKIVRKKLKEYKMYPGV